MIALVPFSGTHGGSEGHGVVPARSFRGAMVRLRMNSSELDEFLRKGRAERLHVTATQARWKLRRGNETMVNLRSGSAMQPTRLPELCLPPLATSQRLHWRRWRREFRAILSVSFCNRPCDQLRRHFQNRPPSKMRLGQFPGPVQPRVAFPAAACGTRTAGRCRADNSKRRSPLLLETALATCGDGGTRVLAG